MTLVDIYRVHVGRDTIIRRENYPGPGGGYHEYFIGRAGDGVANEHPLDEFASIRFQYGPIKEKGVNGCQNEDLLRIVLDRLQCFQAGAFACPENQTAINAVLVAIGALRSRTRDREARGVEGQNKV